MKQKSRLRKNLTWLAPLSAIILIALIGLSTIDNNVTDMAEAYTDPSLCRNAIEKANLHPEVRASLGELEQVDKLAILEGTVVYSNEGNTVEATVRVKGSKGSAKMDLTAEKDHNEWKYQMIRIRDKRTGALIEVL
jgi:hypothetical protein